MANANSSLGKSAYARPFLAKKADNLSDDEIRGLFVEPHNLLKGILSQRQHFFLMGGRGAGKTITLRKLSCTLTPPSSTFPFLGLCVSLNAIECASFSLDKIGVNNGAIFEAYLSSLFIEQLLSSVAAYSAASNLSTIRVIEPFRSVLLLNDFQSASLEDLSDYVSHVKDQIKESAESKLNYVRLSDFPRGYNFQTFNRLCGLASRFLSTEHLSISIALLLDRYSDLSEFQQSVTNSLFGLPAPRHFYIRGAVLPLGLNTLECHVGDPLKEFHDFDVVNLESQLELDQYRELLEKISHKQLETAGRERFGASLLTDISALLPESPLDHQYSGLGSFTSLSDGNVFDFCRLLDLAFSKVEVSRLQRGESIPAVEQNRAAKELAKIYFGAIRVQGDRGFVKRLTKELLHQMNAELKGPRVRIDETADEHIQRIIDGTIRESIYRLVHPKVSNSDGWELRVNRILFPKNEIPIAFEGSDITMDSARLQDIFDKPEGWGHAPKDLGELQRKLFDGAPNPIHEGGFVHQRQISPASHNTLTRFLSQQQKNASYILDAFEYSQSMLSLARTELQRMVLEEFKTRSVMMNWTVALAGSFARGDAISKHSDADLFLAGPIKNDEDRRVAEEILNFCVDWFKSKQIPAETVRSLTASDAAVAPFPCICDRDTFLQPTSKGFDTIENRTRRICLVAESAAVVNGHVHKTLREDTLLHYQAYRQVAISSLPTALFREYDQWSDSFNTRVEVQGASGAKFRKRLMQRRFAKEVTFIGAMAAISRGDRNGFDSILELLELPLLPRLYFVVDAVPETLKTEISQLVSDAIELYSRVLHAVLSIYDSPLSAVPIDRFEYDAQDQLWVVLQKMSNAVFAILGSLDQRQFTDFANHR